MSKKMKPFVVVIVTVILFVVAFVLPCWKSSNAVAGWGDNGGGRPSYTQEQIDAGVLADKIVFNSVSDGKIGSEKNFVGARLDADQNLGEENVWNGNKILAQNGGIYLIRAYIDNNSPLGYDNVSLNTKVAFNIPTESATSIAVHGFIFSDNASPNEYWDSVLFESDNSFHLEYIYGSALLSNDGIGANGLTLSDEIVTKAASNNGTLIGYDALDGRIPGGEDYASYVTIKVMVVFDSDYTVEQKVRLAGDDEWKYTVAAQIGDEVEFQIQYRNNGEHVHENVMIKDILPENLQYIKGTTKLFNSNHPNGMDILSDTITDYGINIGHYDKGANAYVRFTAEVVDKSLQCGSNTLVNWSQCGIGSITLQDYATVTVNKNE
ncbi:MAG: DUF11 domain-containing protein [Lachnospiraceae bacterium]|nr:DUF11 domain-containing protein [Lachnospiraceae bacterium]